jgi:tetratricopeptide (TPR) repeat protein
LLTAGDITEQDPSWLKAKGDDFYRGGDVRSAINAYSSAIEADEDMIACYSNRSACYLRLGMDQDCKEDCTTAIQKLEKQRSVNPDLPPAEVSMLVKLMLRRGVAQCRLGQIAAALADYEACCSILAGRGGQSIQVPGVSADTIRDDIERLKLIVAADKKKIEADAAFSNSDVSKAQALYSEAIACLPEHVACLSNRSACKIALGDLNGCIEDCTKAIELLQEGTKSSANEELSDSMLSMLHAIIPPAGSEKRKQWLLKSVVRRGAIYAQLNDLVSAARDYSLAVSLDPENKDLQADLQNIINARVKREQTSANNK